MRRVKYCKRMWPCCDWKRATKQHERVSSWLRKDCEKARSLGIKCVLARHKLWRFFFISNVYRACMLFWKRFTILPRNLSCQRSYFWWKLVDLFFLRFPGRKWKLCRDQSRLTFSSRGFTTLFYVRPYAAHVCSSILACAPKWACLQAKVLVHHVLHL